MLKRVRFLLPFCLQEPLLFLFPREFVPAFRYDAAELVLTGFLTCGDELPFQKIGAEEDEGIGGTWGPFFFRICIERVTGGRWWLLGERKGGSMRFVVDRRAVGRW